MVIGFRRRAGLTLLEVTLSSALLAMLVAVACVANVTAMRVWSSSLNRSTAVDRGRTALWRILADVRSADAVSDLDGTAGTLVCSSSGTDLCYYLYEENDSWPNPAYDQASYELRAVQLSGGALTYGDGILVADGVLPPSGGTGFQVADVVYVVLAVDCGGGSAISRGAAALRNAP